MNARMIAVTRAAGAWAVTTARGAWNAAVRLKRDADYRKNACAAAAIVASAAFTVLSIDFLITGGPDWNPGAPHIVPEAHAATVERAAPVVAAPQLATFDMMAMAPLAPLEEEVALATLTADDLLGGPEDVALVEADAPVKGEPAALAVNDAPRIAKGKV